MKLVTYQIQLKLYRGDNPVTIHNKNPYVNIQQVEVTKLRGQGHEHIIKNSFC